MRKIILLLCAFYLSISAFAQLEVKEGSFKKVAGFVNLDLDKQTDDNDRPYAVLKIRTENIDGKQRRELDFKGDARTFFEVEYKDGEVWLYISYYATYIKISHDDLSSTEFWFPFDMEPKCGYELTLVNKTAQNVYVQPVITDNSSVDNDKQMSISSVATYINGKFSVSETRQVYFSEGNLQYQASTDSWRFAEHQWDIIGDANKNISSDYSGWIDLFGWATSGFDGKYPYMSSKWGTDYGNSNDISGTNHDWGVFNSDPEDGGKNWRTMTKDEWKYIFEKRNTASGIRYAKAIVNKMSGLILLPDDWDSNTYSLVDTDKPRAKYSSNIISKSDWMDKFEANGAVFLPAAGDRFENEVTKAGSEGYYWSSSFSGKLTNMPYLEQFADGNLWVNVGYQRCCGFSVRLVCDVE